MLYEQSIIDICSLDDYLANHFKTDPKKSLVWPDVVQR